MTQLQDGYNSSTGVASVVALADGRKPFARPNKFGSEVFLVPYWEAGFPAHFTRGNYLRKDYTEVIRAKRGVWYLKAKVADDGWFDMTIKFYDTLKSVDEEFNFIHFEGIRFRNEDGLQIILPTYDSDDYTVLLEEVLTNENGILIPALLALANGAVAKTPVPLYSNIPVQVGRKPVNAPEE